MADEALHGGNAETARQNGVLDAGIDALIVVDLYDDDTAIILLDVNIAEVERKLSTLPTALGITDCGRIEPCTDADVVAFGAQHSADKTSFPAPRGTARGTDFILVSSPPVWCEGVTTGCLPGRDLRRQELQSAMERIYEKYG